MFPTRFPRHRGCPSGCDVPFPTPLHCPCPLLVGVMVSWVQSTPLVLCTYSPPSSHTSDASSEAPVT